MARLYARRLAATLTRINAAPSGHGAKKRFMSKPHIIVLGAGLGGTIAALEIRKTLGKEADVTLVGQGDTFHFVPSNPWVAVGWRDRKAIEVSLPQVMERKNIAYTGVGAQRVHPKEERSN